MSGAGASVRDLLSLMHLTLELESAGRLTCLMGSTVSSPWVKYGKAGDQHASEVRVRLHGAKEPYRNGNRTRPTWSSVSKQ